MKPFVNRTAGCCLLSVLALAHAGAQTEKGILFRSTEGNLWQLEETVLQDQVVGTPEVVLETSDAAQTFKGWGTCFNELGYDALALLPRDEQEQIMRRMFAPDGDLRLTIGRIPVGASDYGRSWYSCDETPDGEPDFDMRHFTIERDREAVIPYVKFAQQYNPDMTFWASPWSPPTWMKTNKNYANATGPGSDVDIPVYFNDQFIMQPDYLQAYCRYFSRFVDAYAEEGIPITALMYQNEAYSFKIYPACSWTAQGTATFLGDYLGPYFAERHPDVELIVGTMNTASMDVFEQILQHPGVQQHFAGIGLQWEGRAALPELAYRYPGMTLQQTESECGSGTFDWNAAEWTFYLVNQYVGGGCEKYTYWNAVLQDNGSSTWGWIQNALVRVDSGTRTATFTPEYYALKHYSHFIAPGAQILAGSSTGKDTGAEVLAARTPEGAIVVVAGNRSDAPRPLTLSLDGKYLSTTLPANSFSSYVFGAASAQLAFLVDEAKAVDVSALGGSRAEQLQAALDAAGQVDAGGEAQAVSDLVAALVAIQSPDGPDAQAALQASLERAQAWTATDFAGREALGLAIAEAEATAEAPDATDDERLEVAKRLDAAVVAYQQTAQATPDAPADFSAVIANADFSDWDNGWTQANVMASGDCKAWTIFGTTCYNNWSNDFTSMDIHQDIEGLAPGWYSVACRSLCGEGETTDQHAYAAAGGVTAVSPVKSVGRWAADGWEAQQTDKVWVGDDGCLRIGYASTSGGGTNGWFCATDFTLAYHGTTGTAAEAEASLQSLQALLDEARTALPGTLLQADKARLQVAIDQAEAAKEVSPADLQQLRAACSALEVAMAQCTASNTALSAYNGGARQAATTLQASLKTETARRALMSLLDSQDQLMAESGATAATVTACDALLQAAIPYFSRLDVAVSCSADLAYAENERATLAAIVAAQAELLPRVAEAAAFANLSRQLDGAILAVRLTQLPGEASDFTFAIRSANVEEFGPDGDPQGWELSLTNGDAKVKSGQHYSGNTADHYFDSYHGTPGWLYYTGHQTIEGLPNGTYVLRCAARSSGEGAFITARTATQCLRQPIAKCGAEGNDGGPIWQEAPEGSAEKSANGGNGYGWQTLEIADIRVTDNRLDIGFTNDSYLTGEAWTGTWFSVDDFRLYYVSAESPDAVPMASRAAESLRAVGGKRRIAVVAPAPYQVYNLAGMEVGRTEGLDPGLYLVRCGQEVRKVLVRP